MGAAFRDDDNGRLWRQTPKTTAGRVIAVVWMLASVALVSILSTSIVSRMTAKRVVGGLRLTEADLAGKRLAAVAHSSGAEYLDGRLGATRPSMICPPP